MSKNCRIVILGIVVQAIAILAICAQEPATSPFTVRLSPMQPEVRSGSRVEVKVVVTNTSDHELRFTSIRDRLTSSSYLIDVRDSSGRRAPQKAGTGAGQGMHSSYLRPPIKPGESFKENVNVSAWFDLSEPSEYSIQLSRRDSEDMDVKSNVIHVTVLPNDDKTHQEH